MDSNIFWLLIGVFLTPLGWIGLMSSGIALALTGYGVGCIFQGIRGKLT